MPLFLKIEALGVEELNVLALQTQAVMHEIATLSQQVPPLTTMPPPIAPPPEPFLTATLVLS